MMKLIAIFLLVAAVACFANPWPQDGKIGAGFGKSFGSSPSVDVYGGEEWKYDGGKFGYSGNHEREIGGMGRHQSNINIGGSRDFISDDGKTSGYIYGFGKKQFNSHEPDLKDYNIGGKIEYSWGRRK